MTRQEFTDKISIFIQHLVAVGEKPVIDYALRSAEEQKRLFDAGLSKCDGTVKKSRHQYGIAVDIYLTNDKGEIQFEWDKEKSEKYHKIWEFYGGSPAIEWDAPHFQGELNG